MEEQNKISKRLKQRNVDSRRGLQSKRACSEDDKDELSAFDTKQI
jgi:hypothetical protein